MKKALWLLVPVAGLALLFYLAMGAFRPTQPGLSAVHEEVPVRPETAAGGVSGSGGAEITSVAQGGSDGGARAQAGGTGRGVAGGAGGAGARAEAFQVWQALLGAGAGTNSPAALDRTLAVKAAFDRLAPEDQLDGIRMALQLVTDEQFPLLYGILFDMAQPPAVLDAIFSEGLNRPEDVKGSMLRVLLAEKRHPMYFESARILDVMGQLNPETPDPEPVEAAQEDDEPDKGEPPG
jgi:hypothetical protein